MGEGLVREFVLGIDLGTTSVGWAIVGWKDGGPAELLRAGSRVFDAGMDVDNKSGKESSRNLARRNARLIRRQHWRRGRRLKKVFHLLKHYGLLPDGKASGPEERQDFLNQLDQAILASPWFSTKSAAVSVAASRQVMPYILRAAALDEPLDPIFLGRALYHLAQRRGFWSNRKDSAARLKDAEDEKGKVETGITELQKSIDLSGARTLGEYFCRVDTQKERIRQRWTSRNMYELEFDRIWDAQTRFHPALLTPERKKGLRSAIFFQRPLRPQKYLVGKCEFEPEESRAPMYLLLSQRVRLLQKVNDLRILPTGSHEMRLTSEERKKLVEKLESEGDQTFKSIRDLLGLKKTQFNLEEGGETKIPGNRTGSQIYSVFGERWLAMSSQERDRVVEYLNGFQRGDKLAGAARKKWGLSGIEAEQVSRVTLESDYFRFSRRAMEKLLPTLEEGGSLEDARFNAYGESKEQHRILDFLPRVDRWREIRNPSVTRSLTELRKVVNAIVRQYGKPAEIRIELARDLRQTKAQREKAWKKNREKQRAREKAAKKILEEVGLAQPSNEDIRKVLLAEECNFTCPYTGRTISMSALVGRESQYDIEHIIPFSRSLDSSFANLTLCFHEENRNVKRNQTPTEAYASSPGRFQEILGRVKRFRPDFAREKLRRFQMTTTETDEAMEKFTTRQLNDTRYATTLAADYLALLYGGRYSEGRQRLRATAGQVTAFLRNEWKLNAILQDGPSGNGGATPKSREDHRHHAVDAVVTALTDDGTIQALSRAAERAPLERRRRFAVLEGPWPNFVDTVRRQIETIVVSHRAQKKVSGALHEETFYSTPKGNTGPSVRRVRKRLESLSKGEVGDIVDARIRERVQEKLHALGTDDPVKVFADPKNLPFLEAADGRRIPIKSARVFKKVPTFPLGSGRTMRHVASESNHHLEIFAELDRDGNEVEWDAVVVSMKDAYDRKRSRMPVVRRDRGPDRKFLFSLCPGESVECDGKNEQRQLFVLRKMSHLSSGQIQLGFAPAGDARQARKMQISRSWLWTNPNTLRARNASKVVVGPLGDVSQSHD